MTRILVVEDDPGTADIYTRILRVGGHDVQMALDADAAMRLLTSETMHFDAAMIDLRMPRMDGVTLLRQLRAIDHLRDVPVVIITGDYFVREETSSEIKELNSSIRFKPLWADELLELARTLTQASRLSRETTTRGASDDASVASTSGASGTGARAHRR